MANKYLDLTGLQDFATKLATKLHTIFATKADVGAPLVASTVAGMTDHDRIYVYTGSETGYTNGNWYYWNGTAWTSGGTYNSQAIGDGTITTAKLASGAVTAEKIADGAVVNSVNGETGAVTGVAMDDGYYENMTVGSADQLISSVNIEDKVPYVFRTSGGANDIGDREVDEIVGGTVAFNQLFPTRTINFTGTGYTVASSNDGKWTITVSEPISSDDGQNVSNIPSSSIVANHVMLFLGSSSDGKAKLYLKGNLQLADTVFKTATPTYNNISIVISNAPVGTYVIYPMMIDLTQMFGSTIADYIYALEHANAGAGVAWFKSLFNKPYYAYNAGQLISVSGLSAHKMTGFNQFDVDNANLSQGDFDSETSGVAYNVVTRNYTRVVGGATYAWSQTTFNDGGARYARFYDADKNLISSINLYGNGIKTFTTPTNACYAKFMWYKESGVTIAGVQNGNVCIHLQWDGERDGEFEPFESHEYALDYDVTLRGVPKLDADNKLYYDGDSYASDGSVQRRFGIVDLGSLGWSYSTPSSGVWRTSAKGTTGGISDIKIPNTAIEANAICSKYLVMAFNPISASDVGRFAISGLGQVVIIDSSYSTEEAFKTAMSGVHLVYELATPTTESAEPYTNPQIVDDWGTEEYVIAELSGVKMPVGHDTAYKPNLRAKLEMSPDSPSGGDGDYIVRQTSGTNEYVKLVIPTELPTNPSSDGTYILKATVSGGTTTLSWEVQS